MVITDVISEADVKHESDDDVIEVVRDDAPIEILSDGEEIEIEKSRPNVAHEFHFADLATGAENIPDPHESTVVDPLTNSAGGEDPYINVADCNETTAVIQDTAQNNVVVDKERDDCEAGNTFINVTHTASEDGNEQRAEQEEAARKNFDSEVNLPNVQRKPEDEGNCKIQT